MNSKLMVVGLGVAVATLSGGIIASCSSSPGGGGVACGGDAGACPPGLICGSSGFCEPPPEGGLGGAATGGFGGGVTGGFGGGVTGGFGGQSGSSGASGFGGVATGGFGGVGAGGTGGFATGGIGGVATGGTGGFATGGTGGIATGGIGGVATGGIGGIGTGGIGGTGGGGGTATKIMVVALNEGHNGNLGGITGANALCATQASAAGKLGTWRAFLSSSTQNAKDLFTGAEATLPVVTGDNVQIFTSWNQIVTVGPGAWSGSKYLKSFAGVDINENSSIVPPWDDADAWNGSTSAGTVALDTCSDWTSSSSLVDGACSEMDFYYMLKQEIRPCNLTLAVLCVSAQ